MPGRAARKGANTPKPAARKASEPKPAARKPAGRKPAARKPGGRKPASRKQSAARAIAHLSASDPVLSALISAVGPLPDAREGRAVSDDHYGALVRSIVGQQLSVHAASAIYGRLTARFEDRAPTPQEIMADDPEELRSVGLSRAKVGFLRSLAEHVLDGRLELERFGELSEEEVIEELVAVKGLGVWTAHMFLMFHLERPDILPVGDLGIRRAMERAYGMKELPAPEAMEKIAEPWRPHRTLACRYLWRSLQNEPAQP